MGWTPCLRRSTSPVRRSSSSASSLARIGRRRLSHRPRTVRLSEAPGFGQPITVYDPKSKGADCYRKLAEEVAARPRPDAPMPVFDDLPTVVMAAPLSEPAEDEEPAEAAVGSEEPKPPT